MTKARLNKRSPAVTITVPQDVIDTSTLRDSSHCMIADAIQQQIPEAKYISVDLATIRFTDPQAGVRYIYLTPRGAQTALLDFDQGEKPEPFKFRLEGAHVVLAGTARKGKAELVPRSTSSTNRTRPVRTGGESPPIGPLAGGAPTRRNGDPGEGTGAGNRTGRRRQFGLRAIIR